MHTSKKSAISLLIAFPALTILFFIKGIPLLQALIYPLKDYTPFRGLSFSPWVGFANFEKLFSNDHFMRVLQNTLWLNINVIVLSIILAFVLGLSLSHVKSRKVYFFFIIIFIVPFFIPQMYWNVLLMSLFSSEGLFTQLLGGPSLPLTNPDAVQIMYMTIEILRWVGVFSLLISISSQNSRSHEKISSSFKAAISILLISIAFILVTDFELLHPLVNPMIYDKMDTLSYYMFKIGFMNMEMGQTSVIWFLQFIFCSAILFLLILFAERFIMNSLLLTNPRDYSVSFSEEADTKPIFLIILVAYVLFLGFVFALMVSGIWDIRSIIANGLFVQSGITYTLLAIISSIIGIFLSILLSYPLTTTSSAVRKIYTLIFILFIAAGQLGIHDYLYIKSLGLINTYFAIIYTHMFHPINVLILGMYYNQKTGNTPSDFGTFIKKSLPAIACLFIANLLIHMDAYTSSLLYIHDPSKYSQTIQIQMGIHSPR